MKHRSLLITYFFIEKKLRSRTNPVFTALIAKMKYYIKLLNKYEKKFHHGLFPRRK